MARKKPNAYGLFDMLGNVLEWTDTWYWVQHNQENINPTGPSIAEYKELRGGGWWDNPALVRASYRIRLRNHRSRLQYRLPLRGELKTTRPRINTGMFAHAKRDGRRVKPSETTLPLPLM